MVPERRGSRAPRTSVWLADGRPARRRERPAGAAGEQVGGLDQERIVRATVRSLDEHGLAAFSMRRLAADLGVTAMSLYWYVESRDDLLELALDAVHGELELPDPGLLGTAPSPGRRNGPAPGPEAEAGWRRQLRQLALGYRALLVRHPWVSPMLGQYLNLGPHAMAFADTAERVLAHSGLPAERLSGGLAVLFQFVHGYGALEANWTEHCRQAGASPDRYAEEIRSQLSARHGYAAMTPLRRGRGSFAELRERDFAFGLDCVFAGVEALREPDGDPDRTDDR